MTPNKLRELKRITKVQKTISMSEEQWNFVKVHDLSLSKIVQRAINDLISEYESAHPIPQLVITPGQNPRISRMGLKKKSLPVEQEPDVEDDLHLHICPECGKSYEDFGTKDNPCDVCQKEDTKEDESESFPHSS